MDANAAKGLENLSPQQKEELMRTVQTQVALANMQELLTVSKLHITLFRPELELACANRKSSTQDFYIITGTGTNKCSHLCL